MSKDTIDLSKYSRNELEKEFIKLYTRCAKAEAMADRLLENYKLSQDKRFGKSSEKGISGQITFSDLNILNDLMTIVASDETISESSEEKTADSEEISQSKNTSKHKNLTKLPVISAIFKLTREEMICPECGASLHYVKDSERIEVVVEQPKVYIHKYITKHYACRNCEKNDKGTFVVAAGAPKELFKNSPASPSAVADCIHKKYVLATPFDRQAKDYEMQGIPITKNNMCHWSIMAATRFFKPIVDEMHDMLMKEPAIHCDETYTRIINEDKEEKSKPYIWVTTTAEYQKEHPIALYNYQPGRSDADARRVLKNYDGYVMCDGYTCYNSVTHKSKKTGEEALKIKPVACMVHIRREFANALKLLPPDKRSGTSAQLAVHKIANIFAIDHRIEYSSLDERKEKRLKFLKPALDDFFAWVEAERDLALPKSHYGQALEYAHNQKDKALRVLEDGRLELQNNLAERTVKPYVIGRKNWLFSDTINGAKASCIIYSMIETAKLNDLIPYEYIKYILEECRGKKALTQEEVKKFLPWSKHLPDYIKKSAATE